MSRVAAGQVLADRYRVDALLGRGGMGAVYRVHDLEAHRDVALKIVLPGYHQKRLVARILREARLASRLQHRHVVPVLDYGRHLAADLDRDQVYLVMELVEGTDLARLRAAGPSVGTSVALARQVLQALAHVHARGVLHRDIKPDNVLVRRLPNGHLDALLTDFGLAAAFGDEATDVTRLTEAGGILGTPAYMAPEQAEGSQVLGPPVDLYAVGVMLYELVTGELPFTGAVARMLLDRVSGPAPRATAPPGADALPEGLVDVIARLLERNPLDRYALAADAHQALAEWDAPAAWSPARWQALHAPGDPLTTDDRTELDLGVTGHFDRGATIMASGSATRLWRDDATSSLWGRDAELAELDALALRAEAGDGQVVLLTGDAGIGKSALAEHVAIGLNEAGRFQLVRAVAPPDGGALAALRGALDVWLCTHGCAAAVVERTLRAALQAKVTEIDEAEITELLALMRPETAAGPAPDIKRAAATCVRLLRRLAVHRPVCIVLDDLTGDAATATMVELLLFELTLEPFAVLVVLPLRPLRPDAALRATLARTARTEGRARRLLELGPIDADRLAEALEREVGLSPREAARVARRAGGNPMFARLLADARLAASGSSLSRSSSGATVTRPSLPDSLHAMLEAGLRERLAQLPEPAPLEALLRVIGVLGEQVDVPLLEEVADEAMRDRLDDDLDTLIEAGLLRDVGVDEVAFGNRLLRDVVCAGLSARRARRLHRRAADARRARARDDELGLIGEHLAAAGAPAEAAEAWLAAHETARALGQSQLAVRWGSLALDVLEADDPRRAPLALAVGRSLRADAELRAAHDVLTPLLEGPGTTPGDADRALLAGELLAELAQERANLSEWAQWLERMEALLPQAGPRGRAAWLRARAFRLNLGGAIDEARTTALEALAGSLDDPVTALSASTRCVWALVNAGEPTRALEVARDALERAGGHIELEGEAERLLMIAHCQLDHAEAVERHGQRALDAHRRAGHLARRIASGNDLAVSLALLGRNDRSRRIATDMMAMAERFGLLAEVVRAHLSLLLNDIVEGNGDAARARLERPELAPARAHVHVFGVAYACALVLDGRHDAALAELERFDLDALPRSQLFALGTELLGTRLRDHAPARARDLLVAARQRWMLLGDHARTARLTATIEQIGDA